MNEAVMTRRSAYGRTVISRRVALGRLGVVVAAGTLGSPPQQAAFAQATPDAAALEALVRQAIDAVNVVLATGETNAIDTVFASDVTGHPPPRSLVTGEPFTHDRAGVKAGLADIHQLISDATITIDELTASQGAVAVRLTFRGTLNTEVFGMHDQAMTSLEIGGVMYAHVKDGRIAEFWAYFDPTAYSDLVNLLPGGVQATPEASEAPSGHGHEEAAAAGRVEAGAEEVKVTLTEFSIALAPTTLHTGQPYAFVVTNQGTVTHEFVIEEAGATHEPLMDDDATAMTTGIAPGETRTLTWTFTEPGSYQFACHQPGHYEAGQVLTFDVESQAVRLRAGEWRWPHIMDLMSMLRPVEERQ
ncbi:MAG: ester cyclase [Thermomicrobiales bacterium]|nr:ester cyclase [Thermomicrobiales bacterium]